MTDNHANEAGPLPGRADAETRLMIAVDLIDRLTAICRESGVQPEPEMLLLAFYASTDTAERQSLLVNGLK